MWGSIFRNITRFTYGSKYLISIELELSNYGHNSVWSYTSNSVWHYNSEVFYINGTNQCYLQLTINTRTWISCLYLRDVRNFEQKIRGFTALVFNREGSIVYSLRVTKDKLKPELNLLEGFNEPLVVFTPPIKILVYLETQNIAEAKPEANSYDRDSVNCLRELSLDFMKIYDQNVGTDITLNVGDVNIKVHKTVLRARSPVFNKMFEHDTSESTDHVIDIEDISAPVLKEFLAFLYSGMMKKHEFDIARELYYAADKYEVLSLQDACKKDLLSHHLRDDTACAMLILADKHGDQSFKDAVVKFIISNWKLVVGKKDFEDLTENYPKLALTLIRNHVDKN